jgi:hypothetical protein
MMNHTLILAQIAESIISQVQYHTAAQNDEDVDSPTHTPEGDAEKKVEHKQQEAKSGEPHGDPAQPFFHEETFHRLHDAAPARQVTPLDPRRCEIQLTRALSSSQLQHCSGSASSRHWRSTKKKIA